MNIIMRDVLAQLDSLEVQFRIHRFSEEDIELFNRKVEYLSDLIYARVIEGDEK